MTKKETENITLKVLVSIRDEMRVFRKDTNDRFEQMDKRFERIEKDIKGIKQTLKGWVGHFDRDVMLLANETGKIDKRLKTCEKKLKIAS